MRAAWAASRRGIPASAIACTGRCDAELLGQAVADAQCVLGRGHLVGGPALQDRSPEQASGAGHGEQGADAHRSGGLTEDGDVVGVAAEGGDVVPHPLEGGDLVEQTEVRDPVPEVEESLCAGPPVDDDADHAVPGEPTAVVGRRGAELEHAALDPHHDRQPGRGRVGRPEVEVQAVLRRCGALDGLERRPDVLPVLPGPRRWAGRRRGSDLRWLGAQRHGVTDASPRCRRLRGSEAVHAEGGRGIRHAEEGRHPVGDEPRSSPLTVLTTAPIRPRFCPRRALTRVEGPGPRATQPKRDRRRRRVVRPARCSRGPWALGRSVDASYRGFRGALDEGGGFE